MVARPMLTKEEAMTSIKNLNWCYDMSPFYDARLIDVNMNRFFAPFYGEIISHSFHVIDRFEFLKYRTHHNLVKLLEQLVTLITREDIEEMSSRHRCETEHTTYIYVIDRVNDICEMFHGDRCNRLGKHELETLRAKWALRELER